MTLLTEQISTEQRSANQRSVVTPHLNPERIQAREGLGLARNRILNTELGYDVLISMMSCKIIEEKLFHGKFHVSYLL